MEEIGLTNIPNVYSQMDQWNSVMFLYDSALKAIRTKIEILNGEFVHIYGHTPIEHIKSRLKTPDKAERYCRNPHYLFLHPGHLSDCRDDCPAEGCQRSLCEGLYPAA